VTSRRGVVGFAAAGEERKTRERVTGTKLAENIAFSFFLPIFLAGKKNKDLGGERERPRSLAPCVSRGLLHAVWYCRMLAEKGNKVRVKSSIVAAKCLQYFFGLSVIHAVFTRLDQRVFSFLSFLYMPRLPSSLCLCVSILFLFP
jgi:hypothetical protein